MIGYQWTICHRSSAHNSDGILATGITDNPEKAKLLVELVLTSVEQSAWGLLLCVAMDSAASACRTDQVADWPPAGEVQVCRRTTNDGFRWAPLYPR
jgi:hypothetical protein